MASRWREYISVKVAGVPSYLEPYQEAARYLREIREGDPDKYEQLLTGPFGGNLQSLKELVVDEFIRVYVSSGGFRTFGAVNYGGFVSGSRYRSLAPYRIYEGER